MPFEDMKNRTDEFEVRDQLRNERKDIKSFDDLVSFLQRVKDNCNTGYSIAPRAIAQAALATARYLASDFGITGFQAGFVMWDFIFDWQYTSNKCGIKIVNYDDMLYPQYNYEFEKTISKYTFEALQKEARESLEDKRYAHSNVVNHWKSIVDGSVPFGYVVKDD